MKNLFGSFAIASAALLAAACVEGLDQTRPSADLNKETVTLTLHSAPQSRTVLVEDRFVRWEEGDFIIVNDEPYNVRLDENDPDVAYVDNVTAAETYTACYNDAWYYPLVDGGILMYIPRVQNYRTGSFDQFANTMIASSETSDLYFYNTASVVKLGVMGDKEGVTLTSIQITGNNNEHASGYFVITPEQLGDIENIEGMEFQEQVQFEGTDYLQTAPSYDYVNVAVDSLRLSTVEPTYIYAVISAQTYENGITVTMVDKDGRVCVQATDKSITAGRSSIVKMADFVFSEDKTLSVETVEAAATSVNFSGKAASNTEVMWALVSDSVWNTYASALGYESEGELAAFMLRLRGEVAETTAGTFRVEAKTAVSGSGLVAVTPDTDYRLIVSYANDNMAVGTPVVAVVKTLPASGEEPVIDVQYTVDKKNVYFNVALSNNVSSLTAVGEYLSTWEQLVADEGETADNYTMLWGTSHFVEDFEVDANGNLSCALGYALDFGNEYVFFFKAMTESGASVIQEVEVKIEAFINETTEWLQLYNNSTMVCNLHIFLDADLGGCAVEGLMVEKAEGEDIFRIVDLNKAVNEVSVNDGYGPIYDELDGPEYFYIDARDPQNVLVHTGYAVMYFAGMEVSYSSEYAEYYYDSSLCHGTYDKESGVIQLGYLGAVVDDTIYRANESTLYLDSNQVTEGGLAIENFKGGDTDVAW